MVNTVGLRVDTAPAAEPGDDLANHAARERATDSGPDVGGGRSHREAGLLSPDREGIPPSGQDGLTINAHFTVGVDHEGGESKMGVCGDLEAVLRPFGRFTRRDGRDLARPNLKIYTKGAGFHPIRGTRLGSELEDGTVVVRTFATRGRGDEGEVSRKAIVAVLCSAERAAL